jgi:hypothetical protein
MAAIIIPSEVYNPAGILPGEHCGQRDSLLDPIRNAPQFKAFMANLEPLWQRYRRAAA